jgi:hypothetical protein
MASEKDFQLLDDYLANRLNADDRAAFEETLKNNSELKQELSFQQTIAEGIRNARAAQLKGILNNIPLSAIPTSQTYSLLKIGTWAIVTGIVATATYFIVTQNPQQEKPVDKSVTEETNTITPATEATPFSEITTEPPVETKAEPAVKATPKEKITATKEKSVTRPALEVYDPTKETSEEAIVRYEREQLEIISKAFVTSSIEVETNNLDRKYSFHYMFKENKLVLFGSFDKHLYEILEFISGNKKTVVLYYKTNYYLLDINKSEPTPLSVIRNKELLQKLKQYRGN